jgi:hypothetical protein
MDRSLRLKRNRLTVYVNAPLAEVPALRGPRHPTSPWLPFLNKQIDRSCCRLASETIGGMGHRWTHCRLIAFQYFTRLDGRTAGRQIGAAKDQGERRQYPEIQWLRDSPSPAAATATAGATYVMTTVRSAPTSRISAKKCQCGPENRKTCECCNRGRGRHCFRPGDKRRRQINERHKRKKTGAQSQRRRSFQPARCDDRSGGIAGGPAAPRLPTKVRLPTPARPARRPPATPRPSTPDMGHSGQHPPSNLSKQIQTGLA